MALFIILMGVTGSGKTTIGKALAEELGWQFIDGDDHHSPQNIAKMRSGIALTDDDRSEWLRTLADIVSVHLENDRAGVMTCSALKQSYRDVLIVDPGQVKFVYLKGSEALIAARLHERTGHFMPAGLLSSQFEVLEEPADAFKVDINLSPQEIVDRIICHYQLK